ncbi:MAG TPA: hypothetical protein VM345_10715 [Acidimicrobiales bacterium]|jgi:hypothetical protein|nr:hypothetical protein [Acidimicrobiales bacterium]
MRRRTFVYMVPVAAALAAGAYVLVYLYRWEWHRALMAGVFMLTLEIGIGVALVLERLRSIEARLDASERAAAATAKEVVAGTRVEPAEPFAWLSEASTRLSVFVPILLGAGVVLSAIAWLVERIAKTTAGATIERSLALRLQPLMVADGVVSGRAGVGVALPVRPGAGQPLRSRMRMAAAVMAIVAPMLVLGGVVDNLGDATQNRPDVIDRTSAGRVVLRVDHRNLSGGEETTARSLWGACSNQIGTTYRLTGVELLSDGRVEMRVRPAIGKYAERRLRGCFGDATVDSVRAEVVDVSTR